MANKMINPLISSQYLDITNINEISREYNTLYILAYKNNKPIDENIYNLSIDKDLYNDIIKDIFLIKAPIAIIKNFDQFIKVNIMSNDILSKFNKNNYILNDKNIVLLMLNINEINIRLYISQYSNSNSLIDIYKLIFINKYLNVTFNNYKVLNNLKQMILNMQESSFWTNKYNCFANLTIYFNQRKISYTYLKNVNKDFENYIKELHKNRDYVDPSKLLLSNEYKFNLNNNDVFTKDEITNLILSLPEKESFLLFSNLLISKSYCHLILNNYTLLKEMKKIMNKYAQLFRYLIGYAWIRFYFEESIKKSFIKKTDQFIFDCNTASLLPVYPFSIKYPKLNPYCTILVDDKVLNPEYNIGGIKDFKKLCIQKYIIKPDEMPFINNGIANLEEFRINLNIFCTGQPNVDIFKNIEWDNLKIALGGSVMCACIQKHNPLIDIFKNINENLRIKRYFNEFYANSDIDVMFLTMDPLDFMVKVNTFYNQIVVNICNNNTYAEPNHIKLISEKIIYLFVNEDDIKKVTDSTNLTKEYIENNLENDEIKKLFENLQNEHYNKYKKEFFNKIDEEKLEYYKINFPDYLNFDDIVFKIRITKQNCKTSMSISYKYKIKSPHLDYPFELFMVNYDDFFATVQSFHLPCVRCYYDGSNVYLTPSCITAHMTYMNIDYKYFAGTASPIEIINKYRMRGFGTFLNEDEKIIFLKYSNENKFWNNLYNINFANGQTIISNLGSISLNHKLFRPRLINEDSFSNCMPIDTNIKYFIINEENNEYNTLNDYITEINYRFNCLTNTDLNNIYIIQTINENGSINPIDKWLIEATWNLSHKNAIVENKENKVKPIKYNKIY
jgi:hypothetical protein